VGGLRVVVLGPWAFSVSAERRQTPGAKGPSLLSIPWHG
jgi:hypothetical protein